MTYQVLKPGRKGARLWVAELVEVPDDVDEIRIEHPNGEVQSVTVLHDWDEREAPPPLEMLVPPETETSSKA